MNSNTSNYPKFISRWNGRFHKALITDDFVFYVNYREGDENGCCEMYAKKQNPHDRDNSGLSLISNNYFAYVGLTEEILKGKDNWIYISPTMKKNYNLAKVNGHFDDFNF